MVAEGASEGETERLARLGAAAAGELSRILAFWRGQRDPERGGFIGASNGEGEPLPGAPKRSVLHARILWTFSAAYARMGNPEDLDAARAAYRFIAERLIDHEAGGMIWAVTADGAGRFTRKHLYAQAFGIHAMAAFYGATGEGGALDIARGLWGSVQAHATDLAGGFHEAFGRDWKLRANELANRDDAPKTFNAHFHLVEALADLYAVWPDPELRERLEALLGLILERTFDGQARTFLQFFDAGWRPLDGGLSHGHDIEAAWLLPSIAQGLDPALSARAQAMAGPVADAVLERALDPDGGVPSGHDPAGGPEHDRLWWVQAEAVVGFLDAFERTGDPRFLDAAERVWAFIERTVLGSRPGVWRTQIEPSGAPAPDDLKADLWKCPYHNGRACLEVMARTARLTSLRT